MDLLCRNHHHLLSLHFSRPAFSKPFSPPPLSRTFKPTSLSLRASSQSNPNSAKPLSAAKTLNPFSAAAAVATAAASLFLFRLHSPAPSLAAVAFPPSAPTSSTAEPDSVPSKDSETLTLAEKERILEEELDTHPDDAQALRALMELKVKNQKLPEAIAIIDRLIALDPDDKDLPLLKAHVQSYGGDTEIAKQSFEKLLEKDPFLVDAYHGLVMAISNSDGEDNESELEAILKRIEDAMKLCKKAKRKEDLRDFKLLKAQIRVMQGKYEESLKLYQELVKEEPRDFRPYLCQGIIYTLLRKKDEAEKQFQKYQRLVPRGHPYARFFDEGMVTMKMFGQKDENRRKASLKS